MRKNGESINQIQIVATLAVAGMVLNNQVQLTNLGNMLIDGNAITKNNENDHLRKIVICRIINDFVAVRITYNRIVCMCVLLLRNQFVS